MKQQLRHPTVTLGVDVYGHLIPGKGRSAVEWLEERISLPILAGEARTGPEDG